MSKSSLYSEQLHFIQTKDEKAKEKVYMQLNK